MLRTNLQETRWDKNLLFFLWRTREIRYNKCFIAFLFDRNLLEDYKWFTKTYMNGGKTYKLSSKYRKGVSYTPCLDICQRQKKRCWLAQLNDRPSKIPCDPRQYLFLTTSSKMPRKELLKGFENYLLLRAQGKITAHSTANTQWENSQQWSETTELRSLFSPSEQWKFLLFQMKRTFQPEAIDSFLSIFCF